jgi:hypothetical protein
LLTLRHLAGDSSESDESVEVSLVEVRDAVWAEEPSTLAMAAPEKAKKRKSEEEAAAAAVKKQRRPSGEIQCTLCRKVFSHGDIRRHNRS